MASRHRTRLGCELLDRRDVPSGSGTAADPFVVPDSLRTTLPSVIPAGSGLRAFLTDTTDSGTLSFSSYGAVVAYRPAVGRQDSATGVRTDAFTGADSFEYQLRTTAGEVVSTQRFYLSVVNEAPVASTTGLQFSTTPGTTLRISLADIRAGGSDADGDVFGPVPVNPVPTNAPIATAAGGRAWIGWGSGISYSPPANFTGTDSFTYLLWDRAGYSTPVTVTVDVGATPVVSVGQSIVSVSEGADYADITVNLSRPVGVPVTVAATVISGTADTSDYGTPQAVTFLPGQTQQTIRVPITDDLVGEPDEAFTVSLGTPTNAVLGSPTSAQVTITDNEPRVSVSGAGNANENGTDGSFVFSRTGPTTSPASITFTLTGSATLGSDYDLEVAEDSQSTVVADGLGDWVLTFAAGESAVTVWVVPAVDSETEPVEAVTAAVLARDGYAVSGEPAEVLILDDPTGNQFAYIDYDDTPGSPDPTIADAPPAPPAPQPLPNSTNLRLADLPVRQNPDWDAFTGVRLGIRIKMQTTVVDQQPTGFWTVQAMARDVRVVAEFNRAKSYRREGIELTPRANQVRDHERLHLAISEHVALRLQQHLVRLGRAPNVGSQVTDAGPDPNGATPEQREGLAFVVAKSNVWRLLTTELARAEAAMEAVNADYDTQTEHGLNASVQTDWRRDYTAFTDAKLNEFGIRW